MIIERYQAILYNHYTFSVVTTFVVIPDSFLVFGFCRDNLLRYVFLFRLLVQVLWT